MNEAQEKPKKKWYKKWQFILAAILLMAAIGYVLALSLMSPRTETCCQRGYYTIQDELKNAVAQYAADHNQELPILSGTYTNANCSDCSVINISSLLIANGGILLDYPETLNLSTSGNDNCDGNANLGCSNKGSYIWLTDTYGNVFSYCAGAGCTTNNSGYQDVWP